MMAKLSLLVIAAGVLAGCAGPSVPAARFHNARAVTSVNDRLDTPVAPAPQTYVRALVHIRGSVVRPIKRALDVPRDRRALGVNALDEVPSSTWFTNRIGIREVSLDEMRVGPSTVGTPEGHFPWTVLSTKVGGANVGFIITDARGEKFILKFDKRGYPETETAADAIICRLLWAVGYNVPEDHVVYFSANDLVLAADAKVKDIFGHARPLDRAGLERLLARVDIGADGRIRGLVSRMLDGEWLGGHPDHGTRDDDPNDRIPHELRRDLRGAYAIFSWLDHSDIKEDNFLDMWVTDPVLEDRHYVKHYMVDFGSGLGSNAMTSRNLRSGHEYLLDFPAMLTSLASLGLRERSWEGRQEPAIRGVGVFEVEKFSPSSWKPNNASYLPFHTADRFDKFWGAKILMRFTPAQLAVAVEAGRYSDPRAAAYMTKMLVARQRAVARYWFSQVSPLDKAEVVLTAHGYTVCFDDLMLAYQLGPASTSASTEYTVTSYDRYGSRLAIHVPTRAAAHGHTCTRPLTLGTTDDNYTIVEIHTTRPSLDASTFVHIARDGGAVNVVGIYRQ